MNIKMSGTVTAITVPDTKITNSVDILEAVLICLFEDLRVKNFRFDRFFQGR